MSRPKSGLAKRRQDTTQRCNRVPQVLQPNILVFRMLIIVVIGEWQDDDWRR